MPPLSSSPRAAAWAATLTVALFAAREARADDGVAIEARAAYDRGAAAYERGDFGTAAVELTRADELVPNDVALEAALRAALAADDPVLGTILVGRADTRGAKAPGLSTILDEARTRFRGRTAHLFVACATCLATLDGLPIAVGTNVVVRAGKRRLVVTRQDVRSTRELELGPDASEVIVEHETKRADAEEARITAPPELQTSAAPNRAPWLLAGGGLTAILGGAALASGLDTRTRHGDFVDAGCSTLGGASCAGLASAGESAERRTNYLLGGAALSGLATAALWLAFELTDDPVPEDSVP